MSGGLWLEKLAIYLKLLAPQLTGGEKAIPVDLSAVTIDYLGHGAAPTSVDSWG